MVVKKVIAEKEKRKDPIAWEGDDIRRLPRLLLRAQGARGVNIACSTL